jgi:succinate-acetate transporter protein
MGTKKTGVNIGDAGLFGLLAFGFSLAVLGVAFTISKSALGAATYALLYAGALEFIGGLFLIVRGDTYLGSIIAVFGGWLLGFFMLLTQGRALNLFNEISAATYMFCLEPPIIFMAIPAIKARHGVVIGAFVGLFLLVLSLGLFNLEPSAGLRLATGIFAFISAFFIWWLALKDVMALTK